MIARSLAFRQKTGFMMSNDGSQAMLLAVVLVAGISGFLREAQAAANPTWRGQPFRRVFTQGETLPGSTQPILVDDVAWSDRGLFLLNSGAGGRRGAGGGGVYLLTDAGLQLVAGGSDPVFATSSDWLPVGVEGGGGFLFRVLATDRNHPIYRWNGKLAEYTVLDPVATNVLFQGEQLIYSVPAVGGASRVFSRRAGTTEEVLAESNAPGLAHHLAFDGTTIAYQTGSPTNATTAVWLRRGDGRAVKIIAESDPLPAVVKPAGLTLLPSTLFLDSGRLYMAVDEKLIGRPGREGLQKVLFRSDGEAVEPLLALRNASLGLEGTTVTAFSLLGVQGGQVFVRATLTGGLIGVFHWADGAWTRVCTSEDRFDDQTSVDFLGYAGGLRGDGMVLRVMQGSARQPSYSFYANRSLSSAATPSSQLTLRRGGARAGVLEVTGESGALLRLEESGDLLSWHLRETLDLGAAGRVEREMPWAEPARFFRVSAAAPALE